MERPYQGGSAAACAEEGGRKGETFDDATAENLLAKLRLKFRSGETRSLAWREQQLRNVVRMAEEHEDDMMAALKADLGRGRMEALIEVLGVWKAASHMLKHFKKWLQPHKVGTPLLLRPGRSEVLYEPLGVVLIISPSGTSPFVRPLPTASPYNFSTASPYNSPLWSTSCKCHVMAPRCCSLGVVLIISPSGTSPSVRPFPTPLSSAFLLSLEPLVGVLEAGNAAVLRPSEELSWCHLSSPLYLVAVSGAASGSARSGQRSGAEALRGALMVPSLLSALSRVCFHPSVLSLEPLVGALAAGNVAVLKPSELSPACSHLLSRLLPLYLDSHAVQAGAIHASALRVTQGATRARAGSSTSLRFALIPNPLLPHPPSSPTPFFPNPLLPQPPSSPTPFFPNPPHPCRKHLTPVTLELGGKNPLFIDESADLEVCAADLEVCAADLEVCAADLEVCAADLEVCAADLEVCAADLEVCAADLEVCAADLEVCAADLEVCAADLEVCAADLEVCAADLEVCAADLEVCAADLEVCAADLEVCAADLEVCAADLEVCAADLEVCAADLEVCAADLEVCAADLEVSARRIVSGKCTNAGQVCLLPDYILASKDVAARLVRLEELPHLKAAVEQFYGSNPAGCPDLARIINTSHLLRLQRLLDHPATASCVVHGGQSDVESRYFAPTLLLNVPWDAPIMQSEIFGPILAIQTVSGVDEAIGIVNARPKPLVVIIFTSREDVRQRFLKESSSGAVVANELILQRFLKESSSGAVVGNELILQVRQGGEGSGGREERSGRESDNHAVSLQHGVPFGGVRDSGTGQ
ncbi:unnamed protein product [Closterium sp. Naga37s-1]|nr:unnamed protein product [Closterium sp. Naga37s-1]